MWTEQRAEMKVHESRTTLPNTATEHSTKHLKQPLLDSRINDSYDPVHSRESNYAACGERFPNQWLLSSGSF